MSLVGLLAKGVDGFFPVDGGLRSVPGENRGWSGENVELFANRVEELIVIPSGEVGAANTAIEQGISREKKGFRGKMKADRVGRMPGSVGNIEGEFVDFKLRRFLEDFVDDIGWNIHREAHFANPVLHDDVGGVFPEGADPGSAFTEGGHIVDMVEVLMGQKEMGRGEAIVARKGCDSCRSINDDAGLVIPNEEVAVGVHESTGVSQKVHERRWSMAGAMSSNGMLEQVRA